MNQQVLAAKKETVSAIQEAVKNSGSVTVVSYQGLTVAEMQELRKTLEKVGTSIGVYKNTLVRRALAADELPDLGDLLNGPNGFVFSKEIADGPKALLKFARYHEALVVKGGLVEGKVIDAAGYEEDLTDAEMASLRRTLLKDYILREYDITDNAYLDYLVDLVYKRLYFPNTISAAM